MSKIKLSKSNLRTAGLSFFIAGLLVIIANIVTPQKANDFSSQKTQEELGLNFKLKNSDTDVESETALDEGQASIRVAEDSSVESVAQSLADEGMIPDATEFVQFMQANGYHEQLQPGEYIVNQDMNIKDVALVITGSVEANQVESQTKQDQTLDSQENIESQ